MHRYLCQDAQIMVLIIDYKSVDFYLKECHSEYLVKYGFITDALETYNINA